MRFSVKEIELMRRMFKEGIDTESLETYKGVGFIVHKKDEHGNKLDERELSREGADFKNKLLRLLSSE